MATANVEKTGVEKEFYIGPDVLQGDVGGRIVIRSNQAVTVKEVEQALGELNGRVTQIESSGRNARFTVSTEWWYEMKEIEEHLLELSGVKPDAPDPDCLDSENDRIVIQQTGV